MSSKQEYTPVYKRQFELVLENTSRYAKFPEGFYLVHDTDEEARTEKERVTKEYCYVLEVDSKKATCLLIYSSVLRDKGVSRDVGTDAIRVVAANLDTGKPIRPAYPIVKRIPNWRNNLRERISEIMEDLGIKTTCIKGHRMYLKIRPDGSRYLICSQYKKCGQSRNLHF